MAQRPIREYDAKMLLHNHWPRFNGPDPRPAARLAQVTPDTPLDELARTQPWLVDCSLAVKPDVIAGRRGKQGLILLDATWAEARNWLKEQRGREVAIGQSKGKLTRFIIEPFVPVQQELYLAIKTERTADVALFSPRGGVDIEEHWQEVSRLDVAVGPGMFAQPDWHHWLDGLVTGPLAGQLAGFADCLYRYFVALGFSYLEINPLAVTDAGLVPLDFKCRLDDAARFETGDLWAGLEFPAPFGREATPEERFVAELDGRSGASLKLTILNPDGMLWTMVAGGGASVVYTDTVADLGHAAQLANYGEYSGNPSADETYEYARTILDLMTREPAPAGQTKHLLIGGGIANFTDVAETFGGMIKAIKEAAPRLRATPVSIWVRRGGPNYQGGPASNASPGRGSQNPGCSLWPRDPHDQDCEHGPGSGSRYAGRPRVMSAGKRLFDQNTTAIVYGHQAAAVQRMLDFDYACRRATPSVAAIVNPSRAGWHLAYWGAKPIGIPMYRSLGEAAASHGEAAVLINFASARSAYGAAMAGLALPQLKVIAIVAEGVPERRAREIAVRAREVGVTIIGPATVGGIAAGAFKIGNAGGTIENIIEAKLHRAGHVAYVSRSGGLSNELNNIIARQTDGVYEGISIGGDLYAGSTYLDHLLRYEADPNVALMVLLGEIGGDDEYEVVAALEDGRLTKPLVAWCIGTSAAMLGGGVQFGHAGARADGRRQTAEAKNHALQQAGATVPDSFTDFDEAIRRAFAALAAAGQVVPAPDVEPPPLPVDYPVAVREGLVRRMPAFVSGISDDRGDELLYAGMAIGDVIADDLGLGGVIGLLWFRRRLPRWASRFIEMVLQITADHGPAVSGAHNTIVAARAGKDLISSIVSGMLTIGPRFGGAVEGAASTFGRAVAGGTSPAEFVAEMRAQNEPIPGIGHMVKSITNPDTRVQLLQDYARRHFVSTRHLDFALAVEQLTTAKRNNLILNVDGCIGVLFLDLMESTGAFERDEVNQIMDAGVLNGLFVLGRTVGLIGHYVDQRRLQQPLYRHPWDDILYVLPERTREHPEEA